MVVTSEKAEVGAGVCTGGGDDVGQLLAGRSCRRWARRPRPWPARRPARRLPSASWSPPSASWTAPVASSSAPDADCAVPGGEAGDAGAELADAAWPARPRRRRWRRCPRRAAPGPSANWSLPSASWSSPSASCGGSAGQPGGAGGEVCALRPASPLRRWPAGRRRRRRPSPPRRAAARDGMRPGTVAPVRGPRCSRSRRGRGDAALEGVDDPAAQLGGRALGAQRRHLGEHRRGRAAASAAKVSR